MGNSSPARLRAFKSYHCNYCNQIHLSFDDYDWRLLIAFLFIGVLFLPLYLCKITAKNNPQALISKLTETYLEVEV